MWVEEKLLPADWGAMVQACAARSQHRPSLGGAAGTPVKAGEAALAVNVPPEFVATGARGEKQF